MISISPPPPINLRSSALFNATLINSGSDIRLYFKGSIINTVNGKKILGGQSIPLDFAKGTHLLNEAKLQPVYSFYDESFRETGFAPYGNYEICLQAYIVSNNEEVGSGCTNVEVTPTTPPLLISPENGSIISEQYPLLTWLAPTPVQRYGSILYDLKLAEIMQNQTAYDAIQRNFAILDMKDLKSTFLQYPVTAIKLDTSKQYVWKVLAKTANGNLIGETEVWTFKMQKVEYEPVENVVNSGFIMPKSTNDGTFVLIKDVLRIALNEIDISPANEFIIVRNEQEVSVIDKNNIRNIGEGHYEIDVKHLSDLKIGIKYTLLIKGAGKSKLYVNFSIIK